MSCSKTNSILKFVSNVRQLFAADDFSRRHFSDAFFLGPLRVKRIASIRQSFEHPKQICLNGWIRKYLQFYAIIFYISGPTLYGIVEC